MTTPNETTLCARHDLPDGATYKISRLENGGLWLRLSGDTPDNDALIHFSRADFARLRDDLSRALLVGSTGPQITADILLGAMRRNLELLAELEKSAPAEVDRILAAMIAHVRSWKGYLLTAEVQP